MEGLKLQHYDCVEDIIEEAIETFCGIHKYYIDDVFQSDEEFTTGTINIIKRSRNKNYLLHKYSDGTWHEAEINGSYEFAEYYKVSELEKILPKLCRKNYNNEFFTF
jgi:hypothetical protein